MGDDRLFALRTARQAGQMLLERFGHLEPEMIRLKGNRNPVTEVDRDSEAFIVARIRETYPDDGILAEEDVRTGLDRRRVWVIDPLDGTVNYTRSHPFVAVSIALVEDGRSVAAAVHAPVLSESWSAARGEGATHHVIGSSATIYRPCGVSAVSEPSDAVCATGFPYVRDTARFNNLDTFGRLFGRVRGLRRCGTASIDLAFVACGIYDAFWEPHLEPFDVAAGSLLIEEAGGRVTDYEGGDGWLFGRNIVATNGHLHGFMLGEMDRGFDPDATTDRGGQDA